MRRWVIAGVALTFLAWSPTLSAPAAQEKPSILVRFDAPRNFGYHIGDLIPLVLHIEAGAGIVVDLEGLPHRGDTVGPFEVRNVRIDRFRALSGSSYRIEFALQTFVPATRVTSASFPPLELRFALAEDRSQDGGYVYRSLTLPPYVFFFSPTAVGPEALRAHKGSVAPRVGWSFWGAVVLGAVFLAVALMRLARDLARWWQWRVRETRSQDDRRALQTLTVLRQRYLDCEEKTPFLFLKASGALRRFLKTRCGIPAHVQTVPQIREQFSGHPLEGQLVEVLERCNRVTYGGHRPTLAEKEGIIREVAALIGRLEEVGCPVHGGNGAAR